MPLVDADLSTISAINYSTALVTWSDLLASIDVATTPLSAGLTGERTPMAARPENRSIELPREATQMASESDKALVSVIMGSKSDWETMSHADEMLNRFGVAHECRIVSAHRTPDWLKEFANQAESRGVEVIIAGAGGAAHLPGMAAAQTILPVLGVPVQSHALNGMDSLLSIVQMPSGIPVGTLAIGKAGAVNAALLAIAILANSRPELREKLRQFRVEQTRTVMEDRLE
jgi:5-(carboxyamino)imidazole ribonucleotide mutase